MITIKNAKILDGAIENVEIESSDDQTLDAGGRLLLIPALIDPHVHFCTPGYEHKENWATGSQAAVAGGVTTVFDMPDTNPPTVNRERLEEKKLIIERQLMENGTPIRYHLWLGADKNDIETIGKSKDLAVGLKIYMGFSKEGFSMDDLQALDRAFQLAAQLDMVIAIHGEDESVIKNRKALFVGETDPAIHSKIRSREAAIIALSQALDLVEKYGTQLYVGQVSTKEEIELIREAKKSHMLVYAEVAPHHLYFSDEDYAEKGVLIQVNPPVRTGEDVEALWHAIGEGVVDTIASAHNPHTLEEKHRPYGSSLSGIPSIELTLPLLLNAHHQGKISLEQIVQLTRINPKEIFRLNPNNDVVLVDLELEKEVRNTQIKSKSGWSPYAGMVLKGWPKFTVMKGKIYEIV